jgi:hypothetical protein
VGGNGRIIGLRAVNYSVRLGRRRRRRRRSNEGWLDAETGQERRVYNNEILNIWERGLLVERMCGEIVLGRL